MTPATNCANPLCGAALTEANRVKHRRVCADCWKAQKRTARKALATSNLEADPTRTKRVCTAFLDELLRNGGFVERAIKTVGTSRRFVNTAYNADPSFAQLWDTIVELGNETIETEIYRRAVQGVDKALTHQGKLTGESVKEYSDTLLIFLAKARMPGKYRDLPQKGEQLTEEELNAKLDQYLTKRTKVVEGSVEMIM